MSDLGAEWWQWCAFCNVNDTEVRRTSWWLWPSRLTGRQATEQTFARFRKWTRQRLCDNGAVVMSISDMYTTINISEMALFHLQLWQCAWHLWHVLPVRKSFHTLPCHHGYPPPLGAHKLISVTSQCLGFFLLSLSESWLKPDPIIHHHNEILLYTWRAYMSDTTTHVLKPHNLII